MKKTVVFILLLVLLLCVSNVAAETLTGIIGGFVSQTKTYTISIASGGSSNFNYFVIKDIESSGDTNSLIRFDEVGSTIPTRDAGAPLGVSIPVIGRITPENTTILFTGYIGYQRTFAPAGTEFYGYQYIVFDSWNLVNQTGNKLVYLDYAPNGLYNLSYNTGTTIDAPGGSGDMGFNNIGSYNRNFDGGISANYTATKPGGIGINGTIIKSTGSLAAKTYILNATSNAILTNEPIPTRDPVYFSIVAESIKICLVDANGNWANSSILFNIIPPTPIPTPTPGGLPLGYTRTIVYAKNGNTGGIISGATLNLKDVENGTWVNATSTVTGTIIDVLNGHTLDIYGSYPGFFTSSAEVGAISGGNYYLPLYPPTVPAGTGKVNLIVAVYDSSNGMSLSGVSVHEYESGTFKSDTQTTGIAGTAAFRVTNNTAISITATKSGYATTTKGITTGDFVDSFTTISMIRQATATPTPYIPPTIGVIPTVSGGTGGTGLNTTGNYTGFWGPLANGLEGMGVLPSELGITLAALLIFIGFCVGGWSGAAYSPGAPFNGMGSMAGGVFGFVLACAFNFIPIVWVIAIVMIGVFLFIFFPRG